MTCDAARRKIKIRIFTIHRMTTTDKARQMRLFPIDSQYIRPSAASDVYQPIFYAI